MDICDSKPINEEVEELAERSLLEIGGSAVLIPKINSERDKIKSAISTAKSVLSKVSQNGTLEEKLDTLALGISSTLNALEHQSNMEVYSSFISGIVAIKTRENSNTNQTKKKIGANE